MTLILFLFEESVLPLFLLCVLLLFLGDVGQCISFRFLILCIFQGCAFVSRFPGFCRIGRICLHFSMSSFLLLSALEF